MKNKYMKNEERMKWKMKNKWMKNEEKNENQPLPPCTSQHSPGTDRWPCAPSGAVHTPAWLSACPSRTHPPSTASTQTRTSQLEIILEF